MFDINNTHIFFVIYRDALTIPPDYNKKDNTNLEPSKSPEAHPVYNITFPKYKAPVKPFNNSAHNAVLKSAPPQVEVIHTWDGGHFIAQRDLNSLVSQS